MLCHLPCCQIKSNHTINIIKNCKGNLLKFLLFYLATVCILLLTLKIRHFVMSTHCCQSQNIIKLKLNCLDKKQLQTIIYSNKNSVKV